MLSLFSHTNRHPEIKSRNLTTDAHWRSQKYRIFSLSPPPSLFCWLLYSCILLMVTKQLLLYFWTSESQTERRRSEWLSYPAACLHSIGQKWVICPFPDRLWAKENEFIRTGLDELWQFFESHSLSSRDICQYLKKSRFR